MKLKLDEAGHVVVKDGKPVYVKDDNTEVAFDAQQTVSTISRLNGEAKGHREAKEAAEAKLKAFEGIADPEAAKAALETVKNIKGGELIAAGKVEEIRAEARKAAEAQVAAASKAMNDKIAEKDAALAKQDSTIRGLLIGGAFKGSKYIAEKFAIPHDLVESRFGQNFKVEDGKIVAQDAAGNVIYSTSKPGERAEFDEALETLVNAYPYKDQILKGTNAGGTGSGGNNNGGRSDNKPAPGSLAGDNAARMGAISKMFPELPVR